MEVDRSENHMARCPHMINVLLAGPAKGERRVTHGKIGKLEMQKQYRARPNHNSHEKIAPDSRWIHTIEELHVTRKASSILSRSRQLNGPARNHRDGQHRERSQKPEQTAEYEVVSDALPP